MKKFFIQVKLVKKFYNDPRNKIIVYDNLDGSLLPCIVLKFFGNSFIKCRLIYCQKTKYILNCSFQGKKLTKFDDFDAKEACEIVQFEIWLTH